MFQDLRYAIRQLRRNRGFAVIAVVTLAVGIGAITAIFSMVNGVLLRSLPYVQPQRLFAIHEVVPQLSHAFPELPANSGNFYAWRKRTTVFSGMAEFMPATFSLTGLGQPRQLRGVVTSSGLFRVLGIHPAIGRAFLPQANEPGRDHEVILTHELAEELFGANSHVLGRSLDLNGTPHTIVGVLPANFRFPKLLGEPPEIFKPFALGSYDSGARAGIGDFNYTVIARLKPGVSANEALAQLNVIEAQIARTSSSGYSLYALLTPLKTVIVGPAEAALWMLLAAAAVVLLIICVNLANLMLVRNTGRVHEVAVRAALGATPRRLLGQMFTEGLILAAAGGGLGLLLAWWGLDLLVRNAPLGIPRVEDIRLDPRVLLFAFGASVAAAILFALLPALGLTRVHPAEALKATGHSASGAKSSVRLRGGLVVGEIALCAMLLAGALLLIQSLAHVAAANQWMDEEHVLTANVKPPPNEYAAQPKLAQFYESVVQKVRALPGVESAGISSSLPLTGNYWGDDLKFKEAPPPPAGLNVAQYAFITPGYFQTIGLPLIKGRFLAERDLGSDVALISESVARRVLHGQDPIGMHIMWRGKARRVIGVVGNVRIAPDKPANLGIYLPVWTLARGEEAIVVRTAMNPNAAAASIRRAVWSVDPAASISSERTLKTLVTSSVAPRRYETTLGALFALVAVLLALLGLYGVISYSVSQRTHEIGIRMALGAQRKDVLSMVIKSGIRLALSGVAIGLAAALALDHLLAGMLYGVRPDDPRTLAAVAVALVAVAVLACYIPARRAAKVDPLVALRYE